MPADTCTWLGHSWDVTPESVSPIVRYLSVTSDLLTSVKKTEDSLIKLKRSRRSTVAATGPAAGVTDDNKIRLQIALDVDTYAEQVQWVGLLTVAACPVPTATTTEVRSLHCVVWCMSPAVEGAAFEQESSWAFHRSHTTPVTHPGG